MLKICILSQDFPPLIGGIAAHVYELSKALEKLGNEVHVIVPRYPYNLKNEEIVEGLHVHRVFQIRKRFLSGNFYIPFGIMKLKSVIKKYRIDVVHYHSSYPESIITKFVKDIPVVFTLHESGFLEMAEKKKYEKRLRFRISHPDKIIGPSIELATIPTKFGVQKEKTIFIPNGVDPQKFSPLIDSSEIKKRHSLQGDLVVLCPRRLEPKNGVRYLVEALPAITKELNDVKFLFVGEGGYKTERKTLEEKVRKYGLTNKVIFTGDIPNQEMPKYFAASDIVVLPSLIEATSIAGLEAMASGKALIGTSVGGIPQIIDDGLTGIIVPPRDPEALSIAILKLLKDDELRIKMGLNARKKVEREFTWDKIAQKTMEVYEEVMKC